MTYVVISHHVLLRMPCYKVLRIHGLGMGARVHLRGAIIGIRLVSLTRIVFGLHLLP